VVDANRDLARNRLVREREFEAELEQLRKLRHFVQADVGVGLGRLLFLGLHVLREKALREHDELTVQVGAVVEALVVTNGDWVSHHHRLSNDVVVTVPVDGVHVVDGERHPEPLHVARDDHDLLSLREPARPATGEQLRRHLAERRECNVDRVSFGWWRRFGASRR